MDCNKKNRGWYLVTTINKVELVGVRDVNHLSSTSTMPPFTQFGELPVAGHQHGRYTQEMIKQYKQNSSDWLHVI